MSFIHSLNYIGSAYTRAKEIELTHEIMETNRYMCCFFNVFISPFFPLETCIEFPFSTLGGSAYILTSLFFKNKIKVIHVFFLDTKLDWGVSIVDLLTLKK